jgi:hypothetical protein
VVAIVQQVMIEAVGLAQFLEQLGHVVQRLARVPARDRGQGGIGRFVEELAAADAVGILDAGHAGLRADRLVAHVDIVADRLDRLGDVAAVGVAIDHHAIAAAPAEELIERHPGHLGLDVPQRHVDRRDGAHGDRAAPPVGAAIEVLPDVLDPARVHADEAGDHVILEIGDDRLLAPVERGIADAVDALIGLDLERDEVATRTGRDHARAEDLHGYPVHSVSGACRMRLDAISQACQENW